MHTPAVLATLVVLASLSPAARRAPATPLETAARAWDAGDYVTALTTYLQILDSPDYAGALEPIALQTGELFHTIELTPDGDAPRFSPDGRHFVYESGALPRRKTHLWTAAGTPQRVAELAGIRPWFSPDGTKLAYLKAGANARDTPVTIRDLASGNETEMPTGPLQKSALAFAAGGVILLSALDAEGPSQIYSVSAGREPTPLTNGPGEKSIAAVNADGTFALVTTRTAGGRGRQGGGGAQPATFGVLTVASGSVTTVTGSAPAFSADGKSLTYVRREGATYQVVIAPPANPAQYSIAYAGPDRADTPALSSDGGRVVFQRMLKEDWELFVTGRDGKDAVRVTREIQHDIVPRFLTGNLLLAAIGEPRHRRSHLYDLTTMRRTRLFHNNTVRTIAPEYAWVPNAEGTRLLIVAERDGDTVSPERGVYLVDLARTVTREELRARVRANLDAELALRAKGQRLYAPLAAEVRKVVADASTARVYGYEKALFDFDSKHISQPGNRRAAAYLFETYTSFGYAPEYQWFEPRGALDGRTANVLATLKGTVNPELVYVVSSHYDSVASGPGADDDSSGTAALLETARLLAKHPQPATIVFASFTGEEAGLLGSREFVRQAVNTKMRIAGALNNDMIGWANDHRLDNTIRYSNAGIRDIQHAAAMQFTNLITYDALYYKSTDAAAYYEAYGDIVGGIGSYPVLGNPHYHQPHDLLDTINHQLVTEVAKTTAATLMLLASSPSRLVDLKAQRAGASVNVSWKPSPEAGVTGYVVAYGPESRPEAQQIRVTRASATLSNVAPGTVIRVRAVNAKGLEGWDWARAVVQ